MKIKSKFTCSAMTVDISMTSSWLQSKFASLFCLNQLKQYEIKQKYSFPLPSTYSVTLNSHAGVYEKHFQCGSQDQMADCYAKSCLVAKWTTAFYVPLSICWMWFVGQWGFVTVNVIFSPIGGISRNYHLTRLIWRGLCCDQTWKKVVGDTQEFLCVSN